VQLKRLLQAGFQKFSAGLKNNFFRKRSFALVTLASSVELNCIEEISSAKFRHNDYCEHLQQPNHGTHIFAYLTAKPTTLPTAEWIKIID